MSDDLTAATPEVDYLTIKHRSASGLLVLISRSFLMQLVALGGFFFLSTFLEVAEIGLFFAVSEIVAILGYFSDVGLAAALIQKKHAVTVKDLRTTFTIQQVLISVLSLTVVVFTHQIAQFFKLDQSGIYLLWALTAGFFLASLKTIPSVILERDLKFDKLVIVETAETVLFYGIAVYFSWKNFGIISYAYAVLARGLAGVALIYLLAPWKIGFGVSRNTIKQLLSFGLPYQANTLIALVKDRFLNLLLFKLIGASGMGIIGWAQTWSQKPLRFISDNVTKVTFPAFSRLQTEPERLTRSINKMLFFSSALIFPALIGAALLAQPLIDLIPRYQKWQPALFAFYLYLFNSGWAAISTPITNTLAAIGKIKTVSKLMVMWTILTWGIIAPLAYFYGYNGVAVGVAIVALSSTIPIYLLHRHIKFDIFHNIIKPLIASSLMGVFAWFTLHLVPATTYLIEIIRIIATISIGALSYSILLHLITGRDLVPQIKLFIRAVRNK